MERWERINAASPEEARAELAVCCGSSRWVERMMDRRPFASLAAARAAAREEWFGLGPADWREAFAHHPKIGAVPRPSAAPTAAISAREQSGVATASADVRQALAEGNRAYEERFGYIYLVCASGRSAGELLAILQSRLGNDPNKEILVAAEEHARICDLRLAAPA